VNHLAYEVDDVEALCERMKSAGYKDSTPPNAHPYRNRRYFYDPEGNDWEFVQYLSGNPAERNDYKLPDVYDVQMRRAIASPGLCNRMQASYGTAFHWLLAKCAFN